MLLNRDAISDENMPFFIRLYAFVVPLNGYPISDYNGENHIGFLTKIAELSATLIAGETFMANRSLQILSGISERKKLEKFKPFLLKNLHANIYSENNTPTARQKHSKKDARK